ncbi:MAG: class I SAM-dependent methyltransferase [Dehalococcoidia bacterium]|nr:class I SAM-dependent methyltransferase [Dehalococcoidia bacterium]
MNMALLDEFQDSLDSAIARTVSVEFGRLRDGLEAETIAGHIHNSMVELRKLRKLRMPDYQYEWLAPFYTSWYQPGQVHLAYSLIREVMGRQGERLTQNSAGNLCVVDFGCGASATRFGLTLAVARAIRDGQKVGRIKIYGIDISQPMVDMGENLWADWGRAIPCTGYLRDAYEKVEAENTTRILGWTPPEEPDIADSDRWLIALHTAYQSNIVVVGEHLRHIANAFNPRAGFLTSHISNMQAVRGISPFTNVESPAPAMRLYADCPETTEWRQGLCFEFVDHLSDKDYNYLHNEVGYDLEAPYCLLHVV